MSALDGNGTIFPEISRVGAGTFVSNGSATGEPDVQLRMPKITDGFHFRIVSDVDITVRLDAVILGTMRDDVVSIPVLAGEPTFWDPMPTFKRLGLNDESDTYRLAIVQTGTTVAGIEQIIEVDD